MHAFIRVAVQTSWARTPTSQAKLRGGPGGRGDSAVDQTLERLATQVDSQPLGSALLSVFGRGPRTTVHDLLLEAIPGSVHVSRTVVEWNIDPANGYLHPAMQSFDQPVVVVCNGGYSSSLATANLVRIGFTWVADLIGGHTAWCAAGLTVNLPDHSHLDIPAFE
jgi:rhodanese-related sulfurtransferase